MKDTCKNCGGWKGIHKWDTMQCPFGGVEAGANRPDVWTSSTYEEEDETINELSERVSKLESQIKALLDAVPSAVRKH